MDINVVIDASDREVFLVENDWFISNGTFE